jgi:DNA-binding transcriptional LysR family regulator
LKDEPLVSAPSDTYLRRLIDAAAMSAGFTLHYSVTVDRMLSVHHHVSAGVAIGILPSGCIPPMHAVPQHATVAAARRRDTTPPPGR